MPCLPDLAACKNALTSVGSRKSLGRCGSATLLFTLSVLARLSIGVVSFDIYWVVEVNSPQNLDKVEWLRRAAWLPLAILSWLMPLSRVLLLMARRNAPCERRRGGGAGGENWPSPPTGKPPGQISKNPKEWSSAIMHSLSLFR